MKKCPVCGKEWTNETKFCGGCGTRLSEIEIGVPDIGPENAKEEEETNNKTEQVETKKNAITGTIGIVKPKKKKKCWKNAIAVVAAAAVVTVGAVALLSRIGGKIDHPCVYLYGNSYELMTKKMGHTIEITDNSLEWIDSSVIQVSPDRKFIYYMENYDSSTGTARLYRCEYQKLSKQAENNEKYKERIAVNVRSFHPLKDGKVIYIDKESQLFCFDGKSPKKIADSVTTYHKIKDGTGIVYLKGSYEEGFDVCGVSFDRPTEEVFLAADMTDIILADDQKHIVCRRSTDEYREDSYLAFMTGFGKEPEKLGVPVSNLYALDEEVVYYFDLDENTACTLEDYVIDSRGDTEQWQELKEEWQPGGDFPEVFQSLYEYKDGEITQISAKDIENCGEYKGNSIVYYDFKDFQPVDLAEVSETDDLEDILGQKILEECIYLQSADRKNAVHITGEAVKCLEDLDDGDQIVRLYMNETDVFLNVQDTLFHATIHNDEINEFEEIPDGFIKAVTPNQIYYASNWYSEGTTSYYDINVCEKGQSRCLATQVMEDYVQIFEDGKVLAYTDVNSDQEYELSIFDKKGNKTTIDDGVTQVIRKEDGNILYIREGDLMLYKNGKSERLAFGALGVWYADEMKAEQSFILDL